MASVTAPILRIRKDVEFYLAKDILSSWAIIEVKTTEHRQFLIWSNVEWKAREHGVIGWKVWSLKMWSMEKKWSEMCADYTIIQ